MNQRRHVSLVAAGATLLASLPLSTVFDKWTWMVDAVLAVGVTLGVALAVRSLRVPAWTATVAMSGAFLLLLTWIFPSHHELAGIIPTFDTFHNFNDLLVSAGQDMRNLGIPVEDRDGLLFLVTLGIGSVGIAVDLFAVVLRRPALAGLPMLAIYSVPVAVHEDSVSLVPFALGACGFLWLLVTDNVDRVRRFGRRFTGDGRDVDLWEPSPLAAAGRRLALVGVLLAIVVPLAVPGMTSGLLDRYGAGVGGGGTGPGTGRPGAAVNLYAVLAGNLTQNKQFDMVRMQTGDPSPFYARFGVADELTPAGFRNRPASGGQPVTTNPRGPQIAQVNGVSQHAYRASVEILNFDMQLLPLYLQPTKIEKLDGAWLYDSAGQVIYSTRATSKGKKFNFEYVRTDFTPEALRTAAPLAANDPIQRQFTVSPPNSKVASTVKDLTAGKNTPYDKVRAILDFFSIKHGFTYSLSTKSGTSGSDIVDFLDNKQGFCEQYSAAMAWLVRAAGIPARVAFGFTRGTKHVGNSYTLTNYNLHAWTEVYFDKFGWVPFDPTPATSVPGSVHNSWAPDPNAPATTPGGSDQGDDLIPNLNASSSASPGGGLPHGDPGAGGAVAGPLTTAKSQWPRWTLLATVLALLALATPAMARALLRRRRWPDRAARPITATGDPPAHPGEPWVLLADDTALDLVRRRAHGAWDELIDTMVDYRIELDDSETPRATAERLVGAARLPSPVAEDARLLGSAEERARYARRPLETDALAGSLAAVRGAIKGRVSWRTRLVATLMPPSVVQRWRNAVVLRSTDAMNLVAARRDALVRVLSPRRLLPGRSAR